MPENTGLNGGAHKNEGRLKLNFADQRIDLADQLNVEKGGKLKVLVLKEGPCLVAQCLQYDFAVHGDGIAELKHRLTHVLASHVVVSKHFGKLPFDVKPAPAWYHEEWQKCRNMIAPKDTDGGGVKTEDTICSYLSRVVDSAEFAMA